MKGSYQVSKWLSLNCLLSTAELEQLVEDLGKPMFFQNGAVVSSLEPLSIKELKNLYSLYLDGLFIEKGVTFPALIMTTSVDDITSKEVSEGRYLIKPIRPVLQIREHRFVVGIDDKIHSNVFGPKSIRYGLQFAYPQLFFDREKRQVVETLKEETYANTLLFKTFQKWVRNFTKPTKLIVQERRINASFRTGRSFQVPPLFDLTREKVTV